MKFLLVILFAPLLSSSQNLIENPSFESNFCPDNFSQLILIKGWTDSHISTDIYSVCAIKRPLPLLGVPSNEKGFQHPHSGNSYAGFLPYCESIQTQLIQPLEKDSSYYLEFYVSLANSSSSAIPKMGALFSKEKIHLFASRNMLTTQKPDLLGPEEGYLSDTLLWTKISGYYKAKGGEQYLNIGDFNDLEGEMKNSLRLNNGIWAIYYYIDDVNLNKVSSNYEEQFVFNNKTIKAGDKIILTSILFEEASSTLLPLSINELSKLKSFLMSNQVKIEISGYTDNIGNPSKNITLSKDRAESVANYLIKNGISQNRISFKGYGAAFPMYDNISEGNRAKNRRVEFKIVERK
ncbi:MAG: OmpA family protein [Bacteroidia bacterium]|nr:OmpA family protein [Bacteroidia bacterium]